MSDNCQALNRAKPLQCKAQESGGYRCELRGPHSEHWISQHTIAHALAGNGYTCSSIDAELTAAS